MSERVRVCVCVCVCERENVCACVHACVHARALFRICGQVMLTNNGVGSGCNFVSAHVCMSVCLWSNAPVTLARQLLLVANSPRVEMVTGASWRQQKNRKVRMGN